MIIKKTAIIATREFSRFFYSPIAYVVLCLWAILSSVAFMSDTFANGSEAIMRVTFASWAWMLIPIIPAISMRLITEELRSGSFENLMTSPVNEMQVIIGKWAGALGFFLMMFALTIPHLVLMSLHADPDWGPIICGYIGLIMTGGLFISIGLFASSLTQDQVISFLAALFMILLFTVVMTLLPRISGIPNWLHLTINYLNIIVQLGNFQKGILDLQNITFFSTGTLLFIVLGIKSLEYRRWQEDWKKFAPQVGVQLLLFCIILVAANWLTFGLSTQNWLPQFNPRIDITNTRQHSLSQQSKQIVDDFDGELTITSLYTTSANNRLQNEQLRRVYDLLNLYDQEAGDKVKFDQIDPHAQVIRYTGFTADILDRYEKQLEPLKKAIDSTDELLDKLPDFANQQKQLLLSINKKLEANLPPDHLQPWQKRYQAYNRIASTSDEQGKINGAEFILSAGQQALNQQLPQYTNVSQLYLNYLQQLHILLIQDHRKFFINAYDHQFTRSQVGEELQKLIASHAELEKELIKLLQLYTNLDASEYEAVREGLGRDNSIVISSQDRVIVLPHRNLFPNQSTQQFRGEEVITGAISSLNTKQMPLIVLMNLDEDPFLQNIRHARSGSAVAQKYAYAFAPLRAMGAKVIEWNPRGLGAPIGQPMRRMEQPLPAPGQKLVYVVLPQPRLDNMQSLPSIKRAMKILSTHLENGGSAFFLARHERGSTVDFAGENNVYKLLKPFGLTPRTATYVVQSRIKDNKEAVDMLFQFENWPGEQDQHAVHKALQGLPAFYFQASPIDLTDKPSNVKQWPIVFSPAESWAEGPPYDSTESKDKDDVSGPFNIVAAAENTETNARVIVSGDYRMFSNLNRQYLQMQARFPANSEIFVNGIYWLAGMEDLIAQTPRSGMIPRITVEKDQTKFYWMMLTIIMPVLYLLTGAVVWWMRRK